MEPIKIALCDDDINLLDTMERQLTRYNKANDIFAEIHTYQRADHLKSALEQGAYYDLFLLDIEMPDGIDGVELGKLIRREFRLQEPLLIYISSHTDYHDEILPLHVFTFIKKNIAGPSLRQYRSAIENIRMLRRKRMQDDNLMFQYIRGQETIGIKLYSILYIESLGHANRLVYRNTAGEYEELQYYATLKEAQETLLQYDFVVPHKSYIVNMRRIHKYAKNTITMDNGDVISITYTKAKQAKARLNRYFSSLG